MRKKSLIIFTGYSICGVFLIMLIACGSATMSVKQAEEQPTTVQRISNLPTTPEGQICCFFLTDLEGWLAIVDKGVWKTLDGGKTWDKIFSAKDSWEVSQLCFINSNIGWAIVLPQGIYKTADGGKTWALQKPPFPDAAIRTIVFFAGGEKKVGLVAHPLPLPLKNIKIKFRSQMLMRPFLILLMAG